MHTVTVYPEGKCSRHPYQGPASPVKKRMAHCPICGLMVAHKDPEVLEMGRFSPEEEWPIHKNCAGKVLAKELGIKTIPNSATHLILILKGAHEKIEKDPIDDSTGHHKIMNVCEKLVGVSDAYACRV